jgi:hypothetical protein
VALTGAGRTAVDRAVADHVANEQRLLSALDDDQLDQLDGLLRTLLAAHDPGAGADAAR